MHPTPRTAATEPARDDTVTPDDLQVQVGTRFMPWAEFWALMDEQADIINARSQHAGRTEGGAQ